MAKPIKRLGRGLDSLVSNMRGAITAPEGQTQPTDGAIGTTPSQIHLAGVEAARLPVDALHPNPFQPRSSTKDEGISSLAESIERSGILQPIIARSVHGRYEIITGERRWRAARSVGMTEVPVIIRSADDEQMLEFALIENIQREDLNPIDRARAYRQFCARFNLKPDDVAKRVGEGRTTVVNYLRLLDLPEAIRDLVADGTLSMGHARCLLGVSDEVRRLRLAESAAGNELSVRALEEIVRREKKRRGESTTAVPGRPRLRSPHLQDIEQRFEQSVRTKVTIHEGKRKGTGRIVIEYYSLDDFDRIAALLGVTAE